MIFDVTRISRLYESTYKEFIKYGNEEKDSFYLLNDILIMICLQIMYKEQNAKLSYKDFEKKISLYEKGLGTPLFFKKYKLKPSSLDFENTFMKFQNITQYNENDFENVQNVLGYVLEKHINRRKTGSYYTPEDTTKYITQYSIFISLYNKLDKSIQDKLLKSINSIVKKYSLSNGKKIIEQYDLIKYNVDLDIILNELFSSFSDNELTIINDSLNDLKIIDPTCGSGAFIITAFDFMCLLKEKINYKVKMNTESEMTNILKCLHGLDNSFEAISLLKMRLILKIISKGLMIKEFENIFSKNFILADAFTGKDYVINNSLKKSFNWKKYGYKFDCIIGNPPYVESKGMSLTSFETEKCGNLYAYTIERAYNILKDDGIVSFIVPLSLIATPRMKSIREYMYKNASKLYVSSFADRPGCIFKGVHQRLTIFFSNKSKHKCELYTSSYKYWYNYERNNLFKNIIYIKNDDLERIPKVGNIIESDILNKINKTKNIELKDELIIAKYRLMYVLDSIYDLMNFKKRESSIKINGDYSFIETIIYFFTVEVLSYDDKEYKLDGTNKKDIITYYFNIIKKLYVETYYKLTNDRAIIDLINNSNFYNVNTISSKLFSNIVPSEKNKSKIKKKNF